jgi:hypothetical protein
VDATMYSSVHERCPRRACSSLPFPMSLDLTTEQQVALAAVRRACALTAQVFATLVQGETLVKGDKSPVTGARSKFPRIARRALTRAQSATSPRRRR